MDDATNSMEGCPGCVELSKLVKQVLKRVADLSRRNKVLYRGLLRYRAENRHQQSIIGRLGQQLREVQGAARATSSNSSIPPSANPPGADKPVVKKPTGRSSGAQMGHQGHGRKLLPVAQMDRIEKYWPDRCERCHAPLRPSAADSVQSRHQQAELPPRAVTLTEYQGMGCRCVQCGHLNQGKIPDSILRSVCGPRLSAAMGYLSAYAHVSRRTAGEILCNLLGMELSLGSVCSREKELSKALAQPYHQLKEQVRQAPVKHVDETGWKRAAQWLWVAATKRTAVYLCSRARTFHVLGQLLGKHPTGVICTDRHGIYSRYPKKRRGLCWSHLKRDFQRCVDRGGDSEKIGIEALAITREVFHRWRWFRRHRISRPTLQRLLQPLRKQMKQLLHRGAQSGIKKTAGLCRRLLKLQGPMWRFAQVPGLEPTNNLAERMLRPAVIWRKICFGSQTGSGCRFTERMLSVTASVRLRGGKVLEYLAAAVAAYRKGQPAPCLN